MTARIFKPAKNAMQSGRAETKEWQLDYEPEQPRAIEPLMGWTSSGDMKQQLSIRFDSKEDAVAYCERKGIPYQVIEPKASALRQVAYADNLRSGAANPGPTRNRFAAECCRYASRGVRHAADLIPRGWTRPNGPVGAMERPWRRQAPE